METKTIDCPKCGSSNFYSVSDNVIRCQYCGSNIFIERQPGEAPQQRPVINLSSDTDVLDSQAMDYELASYGQRFVNYVVDRFIVIMLFMIILLTTYKTNGSGIFLFIALMIIPMYYIFLEGRNGKTIGKYLSGTRAVNTDGSKLSYGKAFFRILCRMIPFEQFSIFFGNGVCWHDAIPNTRVIKDK